MLESLFLLDSLKSYTHTKYTIRDLDGIWHTSKWPSSRMINYNNELNLNVIYMSRWDTTWKWNTLVHELHYAELLPIHQILWDIYPVNPAACILAAYSALRAPTWSNWMRPCRCSASVFSWAGVSGLRTCAKTGTWRSWSRNGTTSTITVGRGRGYSGKQGRSRDSRFEEEELEGKRAGLRRS